MPFRSKAQRRFMYARHPQMAQRWEKETQRDGKERKGPSREDLLRFRKKARKP